ncbi:hypothetical protein ABE65_008925 [Fictibacillus phosphorivorans]|uniref:Uncharacterized protein n=1 Tax=Fictibacillus phosphorivorans TaxID=1221500 RepID=A0A161J6V2_9BACL|nr:hypothetical protein ABE65_008925 [Fictibacillus phosphorivorans]
MLSRFVEDCLINFIREIIDSIREYILIYRENKMDYREIIKRCDFYKQKLSLKLDRIEVASSFYKQKGFDSIKKH